MTWFIDVIQVAPLAVITAPEKRCGKSQLLFLLGRLVNRPLSASNISPSALFRSIDAWQPTLLIDEADSFMRENEELRGIINCGHTRDSAKIIRTVGDDYIPTTFIVWGAKALAGIGHLPDTIMDRAITLELRRKLINEKTERLRHVEPNLFKILSAKLARFAQDYSDAIQQAKPELPDALNDRAQDNWEPLLAIADIAGNEWPRLARSIATKISGDKENSQSIGVELLSDIHEIFESKDTDRISSAELIRLLCADEEKPWATYNRNAPIKPRQIATRLREFGIVSNTIRIGIITAKGYMKAQFTDTFARYLTLTNVTTSQAYSYHDFNVTDSLQVTDGKVTRHYEVT
jgi:putative DNA primase/helicase